MDYQQCKLNKNGVTQTAWIPEKFAVKGKFLEIKDDNGWQVEEIYDFKVSEKEILKRSRDFKKTRNASDV